MRVSSALQFLALLPAGALTTLWSAPLALLATVLATFGWRRGRSDSEVLATLDRVLAEEAKSMQARKPSDVLRFRTTEVVRTPHSISLGWWGWRPGRVEIVRTVRAALKNGYRVRLRAFGRGAGGRVIVRSVEVDLPSRR